MDKKLLFDYSKRDVYVEHPLESADTGPHMEDLDLEVPTLSELKRFWELEPWEKMLKEWSGALQVGGDD